MAHHVHPTTPHQQPQQRQFNPYTENGGTILAIAGADFSVIAGDTRQSEGYSIQTRYAPKVFRLWAIRSSRRSQYKTDARVERTKPFSR